MTGVSPAAEPRLLTWQVVETAGFESAWLSLDGASVQARGRATGQLPEPYWLSYRLTTDATGVTTSLEVEAETRAAVRRLDLRRGDDGWTVQGEPRPDLAAALDCDLGCCPVTNTMPILRYRLHEQPGSRNLTMAFVEVPTLRVIAVPQTYQLLEVIPGGGARVRYASGTFSSDLLVDQDGLVVDYPTMARRVTVESSLSGPERADGPGTARPGVG
ncbi:putative glycolipid-binding domain-containing protein [Streptacidiphilus carbonis]|jgi:uncharacterized protein|uniref:putative glycolipid-binding domain-containing protein n=1 Tax=Streptacidiphilus carbonis TaxID=105422 RepID=UPI0005A8729C|nr:putative glycolipid-binding domain-containing protein [Streptacidiphilus carbonis]